MQLLFVSLLAVVAGAALADPSLEEALADNDECHGTNESDSCALNALQVRAARKQAEESACMPDDQWCGNSGAEKACCGASSHCVRDGSIFKCKKSGPKCVPTKGVCGGLGRPTESCCNSRATCKRFYGGSEMHCMEDQPQCVPTKGVCGGLGHPMQSCCNPRATCKRLYGGSEMHCVEDYHKCAATHADCGGPGRQTLPCCEPNRHCMSMPGSGIKKCM